ncbi:glycoside hydrolase family 5 protein [Thiobacillus denitrificans]|uniref:Cellulase n=1 Tax=Thiobacillus denitrificans TaxID=36861 RepID=A0A106BM43_THIDE|nr:glycoside hydrolase family 5 protein [Thiobacillus denitrificans]KVW94970.1 cellulase [Thiobacillus denitrificans]
MTLIATRLAGRAVVLLWGLVAGLAAPLAAASCDQDVALKGVNLAGAEFNGGRLPGVLHKDYVYPNNATFDYFASIGANVIRLPFRWERIQPSLSGELDPAELRNLEMTVAMARERRMCVILDVHNYGTYRGNAIGTTEVSVQAFIDLWTRLAGRFSDTSDVAFGLMNEPFKLPIEQWASTAQKTVNAIRKQGAKNLILVSGARWSGVHEWEKSFSGTSNANVLADFRDPLKRTWIEVHQYADPHYSGTGKTCVPAANFTKMFDNITRWAKTNDQRLFLGEFGTPSSQACLDALDAMLAQMKDGRVWRGWTYWAAGSWWGTYPLSVEPKNGQDAPQTGVLKKYF